jgi:hypothetical protein
MTGALEGKPQPLPEPPKEAPIDWEVRFTPDEQAMSIEYTDGEVAFHCGGGEHGPAGTVVSTKDLEGATKFIRRVLANLTLTAEEKGIAGN